jgi:hypothetical protein
MKKNTTSILVLAFMVSIFHLSCEKLDDLVDPKTDVDKQYEYLSKSTWNIDEIRTIEYDIYTADSIINETNIISGTMKFDAPNENIAADKPLLTLNYKSGSGNDTTVLQKYRLKDVNSIVLFLPNPNVGLSDLDVQYEITTSSDNKLIFERDENLVANNGALYGRLKKTYKLSK